MTRRRGAATTKLVHIDLARPIGSVQIDPPHRDAVLIATWRGTAVGQIILRGRGLHDAARVRAGLREQIGDAVARLAVATEARRALESGVPADLQPNVSVVVCTRRRPDDLGRCLDSLAALNRPPAEVIVVDNDPADARTAALCGGRSVRHLALPDAPLARLRNVALGVRSEFVAFVDDDCVADPAWLDDIGRPFRDPVLAAVLGYVGPLEFAHPAQRLFELHGGFEMSFEPRIIDGLRRSPVLAAAPLGVGNVVFRRTALRAVGGFDERMGPGTPTRSKEDAALFYALLRAGQRVMFDPARIVWHRHRAQFRALRAVLHDYARGDTAYGTMCLFEHGELDALQLARWWWREHLPADVRRLVRGDPDALPLDCIAAEALGTLRGPLAYLATRRRHGAGRRERRAPPPLARRPSEAVTFELPPSSVVIPSHDRSERLLAVLDGLAHQSARSTMEVLVVLDGCTDGSAQAVRACEWPFALTLVEQPAAGVAAARNRGAEAARHDLIVFLDDDLVPGPDLVAEHCAAHARTPGGITQGYHPPRRSNGDAVVSMLAAWWEDHFRRKAQDGRPWSFLDACAGNSALSRSLLFEVGGFDPECSRGEDQELGLRLLGRGVRWHYLPNARGVHDIDVSLTAVVAKGIAEGRNEVLIARRHPIVWPRLVVSQLANGSGGALDDAAEYERAIEDRLIQARILRRAGLSQRLLRNLASLRADAFRLGVVQSLGGVHDLRELCAAGEAAAGDVPAQMHLGADGGIDPLPSPGTASLEVWRDGAPVAVVVAVDPGQQWDHDVVIQRVAAAVAHARGAEIADAVMGQAR